MIVNPHDWQLVKSTPLKNTYVRVDAETGQLIVRETRNESATIEQAAFEREAYEASSNKRASALRPVGVIPPTVMQQAISEGWDQDDTAWARFFDDVDNRDLRVSSGRVG